MTLRTSTFPRHAIFFGTYDRTRVSRITALIDDLTVQGVRITECNTPLKLPHTARVGMMRKPWQIPGFLWLLLRTWSRLLWQSRHLTPADFVVVPYLGQFDVLLARLRFFGTPIVLDQMVFLDDTVRDRRGPIWLARVLRGLDWIAIAASTIIALDTEEHLELVPQRFRHRAVVVPVGVAERWWQLGRERLRRRDISPHAVPTLVFFGLFTPLQGTTVLAEALKTVSRRGVRFRATIVGSGQDLPQVRRILEGLEQFRWVEWLDEVELSDTVAQHDICIGIFGSTPKALRVVPQKIPLGAAAACALVTSDTPPQRRVFDGAAVLVPPGDALALADALTDLLQEPNRVRHLQESGFSRALQRYGSGVTVLGLLEKLKNHFPAP
jgi:glycosyltransferase involved in cell wall biosynthesis